MFHRFQLIHLASLALLCSLAAPALAQMEGQLPSMPQAGQPEDPTRCIAPAAEYHAVNPWILAAILKVESNFNPNAINVNANGTRDVGMGQHNSRNFGQLAKFGIHERDLLDACKATYVAAWQLSKLYKAYGNTWFAIGAYNSTTPCFNTRYSGLVWNALVDFRAVEGKKVKVASLAQCGYPGSPSSASSTAKRKSSTGSGSIIAFDAD